MLRNHFIILLAAALFTASCGSGKQADETEVKNSVKYVKSMPVEEKEFAIPVYAFGKLVAEEESKLSFKVGGIVQDIYVNEGQEISRGQVLATLDKKEINAQVAGAKASFDKWERDLNRMKRLYEEKVVTLESLENAKTQHDVAVSNLQIAKFNQRHSTIIAPYDGKVLRKYAEVNELAQAGSPIFQIGSYGSSMIIKVALTDKEVVKLQEGDSALIQFDALPDIDFYGQVQMISNAPDANSGLFEAEVMMKQVHQELSNGFFAKVQIFSSQQEIYQFVPIEALVEGDEKRGYVYTIEDNEAVKVAVDIENISNNQLIVRNSAKNLKEVITEGAQYLDPNDKISIANN